MFHWAVTLHQLCFTELHNSYVFLNKKYLIGVYNNVDINPVSSYQRRPNTNNYFEQIIDFIKAFLLLGGH